MASRYGDEWDKARLVEHRQKYEAIAQKLGVVRLTNMVVEAFGAEHIKTCYQQDRHLNNIKLHSWDSLGMRLAGHMKAAGGYDSLCERGCVLKHVAVTRVCGAEREGLDIQDEVVTGPPQPSP